MKAALLYSIFIALISISAISLAATEPNNKNDLAKYVSINIEVKELKESGEVLRDATHKLSLALDQVSENLHELSPEQLRLINSLADKVDGISQQLNHTINAFPDTIKHAQQPSQELLKQSLSTIREETVTPIVESINRWLVITIIGLCLLGAGLFAGFIIGLKKVSTAGNHIIKIANGYRVIPVEQYEESRTPPPSKNHK